MNVKINLKAVILRLVFACLNREAEGEASTKPYPTVLCGKPNIAFLADGLNKKTSIKPHAYLLDVNNIHQNCIFAPTLQ